MTETTQSAVPPDPAQDPRPRLLLVAGVAMLALAAGVLVWVAGQGARPDVSGLLLSQPRPLPAFSLLDQDGERLSDADLRGAWSLLFFGFTNCPDVCPMTLYTMKRTVDAMEAPPRVILVSLDPMRDTPEQLARYLPYFDPTFIGLTGELHEVQELADGIGVAYAYVPTEGDDYTVDHTASLFLIDPEGQLVALFHPPHDPAVLARDLTELLR